MRPFVASLAARLQARPATNQALLAVTGAVLALGWSLGAQAQHRADQVVTAFESDNPFDVHVGIDYDFRYHGAALRREWVHQGRRVLARDLLYRQFRHSLVPRLEIGLFKGLALYAELPIVLKDERDYRFDRTSRKGCVEPSQANAQTPATCVNKTNSTAIRDGIIPGSGFSAERIGGPFMAYPGATAETIFRGPTRRGLDQLHLGLKYAVLRQDKRPAFPTWLVGFESRLGIGAEQSMLRRLSSPPAGNSRVGRKIHEFGLWTSVHRRFRFIQPYAGAYARWSVAAKKSAMGRLNHPANPNPRPQNHMGAHVGAMIVPWVQPANQLRFAIEIQGNLDYVGRGYAYSPAWEIFSDSPALAGPANPASGRCDVAAALQFASINQSNPSDYLKAANASSSAGGCVAFSGITRVNAYASLGGTINFRVQLGPWAELSVGSTIHGSTQHYISGSPMGVPSVSGNPAVIELDSLDVNPQRRDVIDRAGRRYAADDILTARVHSNLRVTF